MLSLLDNNSSGEVNIFVISNGISAESRKAIDEMVHPFACKLFWIDFEPFKNRLELNMEWPIAVSAYGRLFLPEMLPAWCKKVIYLDCDTVICHSLESLWNFDMNGLTVAGIKDVVADEFKTRIGLHPTASYINSGVLLIDVEAWRTGDIQARFMQFIGDHGGKVAHHDQGVINGVFREKIAIIPPAFNAMTPFFTFRYVNMIRFYKLREYYDKRAVNEARKKPVIIHFTPEFVGRAWEENCKHPEVRRYRKYKKMTAWRDRVYIGEKLPRKQQLAYWIQKKAPIIINKVIFGR